MKMNFTDITVNRTIPATAEKIYDVWIDPQSPGGPWHGAERVIFNPMVDGLYYLAIKHEGRIWPHYGRFTKMERPHLVEFTWMSEGTKGAESVVTVTLQQNGDQTDVTLRHAGVPDDELGHQHKEGWTWILNALADALAARRSATSNT
jgi:uncharacterized protein YndB with AHSA1/START domain